MTTVPDAPLIRPLGYLQLASVLTIFVAAALRLPAETVTFRGSELDFTIISSDGGRSIIFASLASVAVAAVQLTFLRRPQRGARTRRAAVALAGVGVCLGLVLLALGLQLANVFKPPHELDGKIGSATVVVILAGASYAGFATWRLARLVTVR